MGFAYLIFMVSGAWAGTYKDWRGRRGSDLKAVAWNLLETSLLTYLVADGGGRLGPHLRLLARTHGLGFLVAWRSTGVRFHAGKLRTPKGSIPTLARGQLRGLF